MKKVLTSILLLSAVLVTGKDLTVAWVNNPVPEQITSYGVYSSTNNGVFALMTATATNSFTIINVAPALYQFQVRARNLWGEGSPSTTVGTPSGLPTSTISVTVTISP